MDLVNIIKQFFEVFFKTPEYAYPTIAVITVLIAIGVIYINRKLTKGSEGISQKIGDIRSNDSTVKVSQKINNKK